MTAEPTVFVVDDNAGVRKGLTALLESEGIAVETYPNADAFLAAINPGRRGCLVLDIRLRGSDGLDIQDELRRRKVPLPVIVLTGHGNVPTSVRALKAGAVDFLQKPMPPDKMLERIRAALEQDREAHAVVEQKSEVLQQMASLTPREREVMDLLLAGHSSKEIASAMQISVRTVEGHRRMVFSKLGVSSAAQLVRFVLSTLPPPPPTDPRSK